jgi:hypothetical protein
METILYSSTDEQRMQKTWGGATYDGKRFTSVVVKVAPGVRQTNTRICSNYHLQQKNHAAGKLLDLGPSNPFHSSASPAPGGPGPVLL